MTQKINLLFTVIISTLALSCKSQTVSKEYILTKDEKVICDTLQIDSTIIKDIREFNRNKIEPFHYSPSKIITKDSDIEEESIYLKGILFFEDESRSYDLVFYLKDKFREKGYTIFRWEDIFSVSSGGNNVAVLKTTDKYNVLKQIQTDGINYGITNDSLISIIRTFDNKYSLELIGASGEWCEFVIHREPKDWIQFAKEVYKVCPDVVDQGTNTIEALAEEMKRTKVLYLWWD